MNEELARGLLDRSRDERVHSAVWDFREGKTSWAELLRDDGVRRELRRWYAEAFAEQAARGNTPERMRQRLVDSGVLRER